MAVELRPYQTQFVSDIRTAFAQHRRVLAVAATGAGKTVVFVFIATSAVRKGKRVVIVAHRVEIVDQISRALDAMGVRHGRIQTGHTMTDDPVQVAMVITLAKRLEHISEPDLLVIDECHHGVTGSYTKISSEWQRARILGVTATPERLDGRGLGECFDHMVIGPQTAELVAGGWLAPFTYLAPPTQIDLSGVHTRAGDFAVDELADAMDKAVITGNAIRTWENAIGRRPAIAFCVTVEHAEHVSAQFREAGYRAQSVDGKLDKTTRRDRIAAIGDGRLDVLTSCDLISEGTDIPAVAGAILLRPTQSLGLWLQQVGRVLRLKPDGSRAVIADHVGNIHRHGMPDAPRAWSLEAKKRKKTAAAVTQCDVCYRVFATGPGWRADAECGADAAAPADCVLATAETESEGRQAPEVVEGELVEFTTTPAWALGIDIAAARGDEWKALLHHAGTDLAKLKQIQKARGYHHKWIKHVLRERHSGERFAA